MPLGEYNYNPPSLAEILLGHMMPMAGGQTDDRLMLDYLRRMQDEGGSDRWRELGRDADMGSMLTDDTGLMLEALKKMQDEGRDPQGRLLDSGIPSVLQSKTYDHLYDESWVPQVVDPPMPPPSAPPMPPPGSPGGGFDAGMPGLDALGMTRGQAPQQEMGPPEPAQNSWDAFVAMNPGLDYDKVVQQAGGVPGSFPVENEFGGAISEMPSSPEQQAQVASLMDYVKNQIPKDEANRMLDKRSRAYDPDAAKMILEQLAQDQALDQTSAALKIEGIRAEAQRTEAEAYEKLASRGKSKSGYSFGGESSGANMPTPSQLTTAAKELDDLSAAEGTTPEMAKQLADDASKIRFLANSGRIEEAMDIISKYVGERQTQQDSPGNDIREQQLEAAMR